MLLGGSKRGSGQLDLLGEYKFLVYQRIAGHASMPYHSGLASRQPCEIFSANPLRSGAVASHDRRER
jgi:hypothetical protein